MQEHIANNQGLKIMQDSVARNTPIPGQSLTNPVDSRQAWENPPKITKLQEGIHHIFRTLIEPEISQNVVASLEKGVPVLDISSAILYEGFETGKWNPDLMLLLQEPTMYMIMAIGEKSGLEDMRIYAGEEKDNSELYAEEIDEALRKDVSFKNIKPDTIGKESIPVELQEKIKELSVPSLLNRGNTEVANIENEEETISSQNLLGRS